MSEKSFILKIIWQSEFKNKNVVIEKFPEEFH